MQKQTSHLHFDGYCPESALSGKKVKMRLNMMDFFESEETGLQIYIIPQQLAVILNKRGIGLYKASIIYAHEYVKSENLAIQNKPTIPFVHDAAILKDTGELASFIKSIK
jgi:hypothetical protein